MTSVNDIFNFVCDLAPLGLQLDFDNSGLLFGRKDAAVSKALLSLDITPAVIDEAAGLGAELIISHHPLIFSALKTVTDNKLLMLAENRIAVISMHTNLDIAAGGVNDVLMSVLGAESAGSLDSFGCGRIGSLPQTMTMPAFLSLCKQRLNAGGLRYYDSGKPVKKLAVMGGSGGDSIEDAIRLGCDTYLTADIKYHQFLQAAELGINLIDGGHFCTENPVIPVLAAQLSARFDEPEFIISSRHDRIIRFA